MTFPRNAFTTVGLAAIAGSAERVRDAIDHCRRACARLRPPPRRIGTSATPPSTAFTCGGGGDRSRLQPRRRLLFRESQRAGSRRRSHPRPAPSPPPWWPERSGPPPASPPTFRMAPSPSKGLGRLTRAVDAMAEDRGKEALALLSRTAIPAPHADAAALLKPWAAAQAGDWTLAETTAQGRLQSRPRHGRHAGPGGNPGA